MCELISGLYNHNTGEISVTNWMSHSENQRITGYSERAGWYEFHYMLDGKICCRLPERARDAAQEAIIREKWGTVEAFMRWCIDVRRVNYEGVK